MDYYIPSVLKTGKNALMNTQLFLSDGYLKSFSFKKMNYDYYSKKNRSIYVNYSDELIYYYLILFNLIKIGMVKW
jgi:hypothetical protein